MNRRTVLAALPCVAAAGCLSNPLSSDEESDPARIGRLEIDNVDETGTEIDLAVLVDDETAHEKRYEIDPAEKSADGTIRASGVSLEDPLPFEGYEVSVRAASVNDSTEATFDAAGCHGVRVYRENGELQMWHAHGDHHCSNDGE